MANLIDLTKKARITLEKKNILNEKLNVVLALDISISMSNLFKKGIVQETVERILGIGMNMDSNQEIEVYVFGESSKQIGSANERTITDFVHNQITKKMSLESSTRYAGVIGKISNDFTPSEQPKGFLRSIFQKKTNSDEKLGTVVFFITDGDNQDKSATTKLMQSISGKPIFWQFIGLGKTEFSYLEKLDNLSGRIIDNANFFKISDISAISDEELYDKVLDELPSWLSAAREKGIL